MNHLYEPSISFFIKKISQAERALAYSYVITLICLTLLFSFNVQAVNSLSSDGINGIYRG